MYNCFKKVKLIVLTSFGLALILCKLTITQHKPGTNTLSLNSEVDLAHHLFRQKGLSFRNIFPDLKLCLSCTVIKV